MLHTLSPPTFSPHRGCSLSPVLLLGGFPGAPVAGCAQSRSVSFFHQQVHPTCFSHGAKKRKRSVYEGRLKTAKNVPDFPRSSLRRPACLCCSLCKPRRDSSATQARLGKELGSVPPCLWPWLGGALGDCEPGCPRWGGRLAAVGGGARRSPSPTLRRWQRLPQRRADGGGA